MIREGSKPDPYVILSVGKTQFESVEKTKTSDPVYEQTFHFLVRNPLTDTLLVKVVDRKTGADLGALKQSLDLVYHRPDMKMEKQNLSLNTKSEAKIILTMEVSVLKQGLPKAQSHDDDDDELPGASGVHPTQPSGDAARPQASTADPNPAASNSSNTDTERQNSNGSGGADEGLGLEVAEPVSVRAGENAPLLDAAPGAADGSDMKVRLTIRYRYDYAIIKFIEKCIFFTRFDNDALCCLQSKSAPTGGSGSQCD